MDDVIQMRREGYTATITLNNPEKRNALTILAWRALADAFSSLSADKTIRCIIIRGAGDKAFAAGADISEFPNVRSNAGQAKEYGKATSLALKAVVECIHPTIALIEGACTGGGLEIATACDIRIANASSKFGVPINRLGHPLAYPEMMPVLMAIGRANILDLLLTGRIIRAEEALRIGLVTQVFPDHAIENEVYEMACSISEAAPLSNRYTKKFVNRLTANLSPLSQEELEESYTLCDSDDYTEGVRAFLAKQNPVFRGR